MRPLLVYVADKNMAEAVSGLLDREGFHRAVACAPFDFDSRRDLKVANGQNDPGIYTRGAELMRPYRAAYERAVLIADEEWDGSPGADTMRRALRAHLDAAGWVGDNGLPLVVSPEADVWLWSDSPHSALALGWAGPRGTNCAQPCSNRACSMVTSRSPRDPRKPPSGRWRASACRGPRGDTARWQVRSRYGAAPTRHCRHFSISFGSGFRP